MTMMLVRKAKNMNLWRMNGRYVLQCKHFGLLSDTQAQTVLQREKAQCETRLDDSSPGGPAEEGGMTVMQQQAPSNLRTLGGRRCPSGRG